MFDVIANFKNRNIVTSITLEDLVETIRNPSKVAQGVINKARDFGKDSVFYDEIKKTLPCVIPNFRHNKYVKNKTIINSTGFIYIDIDYSVDINFEEYPFVAAAWTSLSGIGKGMLISVGNSEAKLDNIKSIINKVSNIMDIKPDTCAISLDRTNVISFDPNIYYNPNYSIIEPDEVVHKVCQPINNNNINNRLLADVTFYDGELRFSNLLEKIKDYSFDDDEVWKDLGDNKINYCEIYIPKTISVGERNSKLFNMLSMAKGLNPNVTFNRLYNLAKYLNTKCYEEIPDEELRNIVLKITSKDAVLYSNKTKRFIFNEDYMLTRKEKLSICATERNKKIGEATNEKILEVINNWDVTVNGKLTYSAIAKVSKVSYRTVMRKKQLFSEYL